MPEVGFSHESAQAKFDAAEAADTGGEGIQAPQESAPVQQQAEAAPVESPPAPSAPEKFGYDVGGQRYEMTPDEARQAIAEYHQLVAQQHEARQQPQPQQTQPQATQPDISPEAKAFLDQYNAPLYQQIEELTSRLSETEQKSVRQEIEQDVDLQWGKSEAKDLVGEDHASQVKALVHFMRVQNPDISTQTAMEKVEGLVKGIASKAKTTLVEGKVQAQQNAAPTGGSGNPNQGPEMLSREKFMAGGLVDRIKQKVAAAAMQG